MTRIFGMVMGIYVAVHFTGGLGCACRAADGETPSYSRLRHLSRPQVIYRTDFSDDFRYQVPHRHDTSSEAKILEDGVLTVRIRPGMHGASSDAPDHERAEYSHRVPLDALVRQSFRVRVDADFAAPKRTLIAQIKPDPISPLSPPVSLYLSEQGAAKWVEYSGRDRAQQNQHHVSLRDHGIDLLDGGWHTVAMEYLRSNDDGYCRLVVDGRVVFEQRGYCSNPGGEHLNARIGIYRDAMPFEQRVYFDDWVIEVLAEEATR